MLSAPFPPTDPGLVFLALFFAPVLVCPVVARIVGPSNRNLNRRKILVGAGIALLTIIANIGSCYELLPGWGLGAILIAPTHAFAITLVADALSDDFASRRRKVHLTQLGVPVTLTATE